MISSREKCPLSNPSKMACLSLIVVEAQIPHDSLCSSAWVRHSLNTGQVSQISCAVRMAEGWYLPFLGAPKNRTSSTLPRHAACACHLGQSLLTSG